MRKGIKIFLFMVLTIGLIWVALTFYVELHLVKKQGVWNEGTSEKALLVIYQPDPFYPFDEQIGRKFSQPFVLRGWKVEWTSSDYRPLINPSSYYLILIISNTYNWAPDWPTVDWIKEAPLKGKKVIAITLGAGSTEFSKKSLDTKIKESGATLLDSRTFWLLRPNDESQIHKPNVEVAKKLAEEWGEQVLDLHTSQ